MAGRLPFPQRLPGTYFDIESEVRQLAPPSDRGIVIDMMPLTWFNEGELVDIHSREWQSAFAITKLGVSAAMPESDDEFTRDTQRSLGALMASGRIAGQSYGPTLGKIYPQNTGGAKAQGTLEQEPLPQEELDELEQAVTDAQQALNDANDALASATEPAELEAAQEVVAQAEEALAAAQNTLSQGSESATITFVAKKSGAAGNSITVNVVRQEETYAITTFFNAQRMYAQVITEKSQLPMILRQNKLVGFEGDLDGRMPIGEVMLEGGDNGTVEDYATRLQSFLDVASAKTWHTISLAIAPEDEGYALARIAFRSWLRQTNNDLQEERHSVAFGDFEDSNAGMDSDQIDVVFQDLEWASEFWLGKANVVRFFAGRSAGTPANRSQTNDVINNVTNIRPELTIRQREAADARGLFAIIGNWDGRFKIQRDSNSFVSVVPTKNIQWRDNRVKRGIHDWMTRVARMNDTQHIGKTNNNEKGREKMLGDANNLALIMETENVLQEHDISKLSIVASDDSPTAVFVEARRFMFVSAIDTVDIFMTITF